MRSLIVSIYLKKIHSIVDLKHDHFWPLVTKMSPWHLDATGANLYSCCRVIPAHYRKCPSPVTGCEQLWQFVFKATSAAIAVHYSFTQLLPPWPWLPTHSALSRSCSYIAYHSFDPPWCSQGFRSRRISADLQFFSDLLEQILSILWNSMFYTRRNYELYISYFEIIRKYGLYYVKYVRGHLV